MGRRLGMKWHATEMPGIGMAYHVMGREGLGGVKTGTLGDWLGEGDEALGDALPSWLGVGDVCFFLTMRCFNDSMFSNS